MVVDSVADEVIITIQEQLGTYGTLALDKNANWTYTLDNTDSDTIGLVTGETAKDSFTINVSDGYETISQQINVIVIGSGSSSSQINTTTFHLSDSIEDLETYFSGDLVQSANQLMADKVAIAMEVLGYAPEDALSITEILMEHKS